MGRQPSDHVQMLEKFDEYLTETNPTAKFVLSETMETECRKDPYSIWATYNHGGPITKNQIAFLVRNFKVFPQSLHPTGRKDFGRMGYLREHLIDPCARYLPGKPIIQSLGSKTKPPKRKVTKRKTTKRINKRKSVKRKSSKRLIG